MRGRSRAPAWSADAAYVSSRCRCSASRSRRPPAYVTFVVSGSGDDEDVLLADARLEQAGALHLGRAAGEQRAERAAPALEHLGLEPGIAHPVERELLVVDGRVRDQQRAAGFEVMRRLGDQPIQERAAVRPRLGVARGAASRERGRRGQVRRVGDDQVEGLAGHGIEQLAAAGADAYAVESRVEVRRHERPSRDVYCGHRSGGCERGRDCQHARAGTDVEHGAVHARVTTEVLGQHPRVASRCEDPR